MWDLIVSVPDHCLSFYLEKGSNLCIPIHFPYKLRNLYR